MVLLLTFHSYVNCEITHCRVIALKPMKPIPRVSVFKDDCINPSFVVRKMEIIFYCLVIYFENSKSCFSLKPVRICASFITVENWVGVYTVKDCYPVQETYTKNYSVTTSTRFFDLKLGISDPSVFIPPSTCQTAQSEKMTYVC